MLPLPFQFGLTWGWHQIKQELLSLGYQLGLNLFAVPFDWRKTTVAARAGDFVVDTIRQAYNLTGKPAVLVSHSLGNFGMYTAFTEMS